MARAVVAVILAGFAAPVAAQPITAVWTGQSGNWTNPALWSTNPNYPNNGTPPGTTYNAMLGGPGTLILDTAIAIQGLVFRGSTLSGPGNLTLAASLNWQEGGTFGGTTTTTINGGWSLPLGTATPPRAVGNGAALILNAGSYAMAGLDPTLMVNGTLTVRPGVALAGMGASFLGTGTVRNFGLLQFLPGFPTDNRIGVGAFQNSGTLEVGAPVVASSGVANVGGTLRGTGSLPGSVTLDAASTLAPGASSPANATGVLTLTGAVMLAPGARFELDLKGPTAGAGYDRVSLGTTGAINLAGATLAPLLGYAPAPADALTVLIGGNITGTFANAPPDAMIDVGIFNAIQYSARVHYTPSSVVFDNFQGTPIPEPMSLALVGFVVAGWFARRHYGRFRTPDPPAPSFQIGL